MGIAEETAELWEGVGSQPEKGKEEGYYAELLRKTMISKKKLAETGRPYTILPPLRELVRRQMVRVPAEHVPFLEISVFDLVANPLKAGLQKYVSQFTEADIPLVEWFVKASKKDASLCLNNKVLTQWLEGKKPKEPEQIQPQEQQNEQPQQEEVPEQQEQTQQEEPTQEEQTETNQQATEAREQQSAVQEGSGKEKGGAEESKLEVAEKETAEAKPEDMGKEYSEKTGEAVVEPAKESGDTGAGEEDPLARELTENEPEQK